MSKPKINRAGQYFERLLILYHAYSHTYGSESICLCECGKIYRGLTKHIVSHNVRSCGCLHSERLSRRASGNKDCYKHGDSGISEYRAWQGAKDRCTNPNHKQWDDYGGRGIRMCERWLNSYENFIADMGYKSSPELSLDRFPDRNGDYEPGNCRWATVEEQNNNTRRNYY